VIEMDIEAKFGGIDRKEGMKTIKKPDGTKVDEMEVTYVMKAAIKKAKYDKTTENVKEGTADPWVRINISSLDENAFKEFEDANAGDPIIISVCKV